MSSEHGVGNFTARIFIIPSTPHTVNLWLAVNPCLKENLKNLAPNAWNKPGFPQVPLNLSGGSVGAIQILMVTKEPNNIGWGLETLPLRL